VSSEPKDVIVSTEKDTLNCGLLSFLFSKPSLTRKQGELRLKNASLGLACLTFIVATSSAQQPVRADTSRHTVQLVSVEPDVKLEVLDWAGTGRPIVFLAGMGLDAHEFDDFAPRFSPKYHVYAISRRGFGASSAPSPRKITTPQTVLVMMYWPLSWL
jgi:hypothetical protein